MTYCIMPNLYNVLILKITDFLDDDDAIKLLDNISYSYGKLHKFYKLKNTINFNDILKFNKPRGLSLHFSL